jgi:hypothetical protein
LLLPSEAVDLKYVLFFIEECSSAVGIVFGVLCVLVGKEKAA